MEAMSQEAAGNALTVDRRDLLAAVDDAASHPPIAYTTFWEHPLTALDLVAHVLAWDEINLAVLAEARRGRPHWSLDRDWETREAGRAINRSGVLMGRELGATLTLHRFEAVRAAFLDAIAEVPVAEWAAELPFRHGGDTPQTLGGLCHYVNTPEADPTRTAAYRHAAVHLGAAGNS